MLSRSEAYGLAAVMDGNPDYDWLGDVSFSREHRYNGMLTVWCKDGSALMRTSKGVEIYYRGAIVEFPNQSGVKNG